MVTKTIRANTLALLGGRLASAALGLVVAVISARVLDERFGAFAAVLAAGFVANTFVTFGSDTLVVRHVARGGDSDLASAVGFLQLAAAIALSAIAIVLERVGVVSGAVAIQSLALIPQAIVTVAAAVLRGRQQMTRLIATNVAGSVVGAAAAIALVTHYETVWAPIAGLGVGHLVTAIGSASIARLAIRPPASMSQTWSILADARTFAVMVAATTVSAQVALVLVGAFGLVGAAGFAASTRFVEAARLLPASAYGAAFPAMADDIHRSASYRRWSGWLIGFGIAVTAVLIAAAEPLSNAVFGDLEHASAVLRVLALGLVPIVLRLRWSFERIAEGDEATVARIAVATAIVVTVGSMAVAVAEGPVTVIAGIHSAAIAINALLLFPRHRPTRSSGETPPTAPPSR